MAIATENLFPDGYLPFYPDAAFPGEATTLSAWSEPGEEALTYDLAVPLHRYAQIIRADECAFFGIRKDGQIDAACDIIWTKDMRNMVAHYLAQAQQMIEASLRYPVVPTFVVGDGQIYKCKQLTHYGYVIEPGVRAETTLGEDVVVDLATDPAVVTVSGLDLTTITDLQSIRIYYPNTYYRIYPSQIEPVGADTLRIAIPRCRLVELDLMDIVAGSDYSLDDNFIDAVDVVHVYADTNVQAHIISAHRCNILCGAANCTEYTTDGCMRIFNRVIGGVEVLPDSTSGNVCSVRPYERVRMYYRAGRWRQPPPLLESAIVRLAHTLMPEEPCNCDVLHRMWVQDNVKPQWTTMDRHNNPFGLSDGAWMAWQFVNSPGMRLHRARVA